MPVPVVRIILYVKDIPAAASFYQRHFGLQPKPSTSEGWLELSNPAGGCDIALHQASKAQKSGAAMKLVFGVADVEKFKREREADGLSFGPVHHADGVAFANAKDPSGNAIQISNRGVRTKPVAAKAPK